MRPQTRDPVFLIESIVLAAFAGLLLLAAHTLERTWQIADERECASVPYDHGARPACVVVAPKEEQQ